MSGRLVAAVLQIAVIALLTRSLGVNSFGVFASSSAIALVVVAFVELGGGVRVLRVAADPDAGGVLSTLLILRLTALVALPLLALIVEPAAASPVLIAASCAYAVGETAGDLGVGILQGIQRPLAAMATLVLRRLIPVVILIGVPSVDGALVALVATGVVGFSVLVIVSWGRLARPRSPLIILRENYKIMLSGAGSTVSQLDVPIIAAVAGPTIAGLYAAATRLFNPLNLVVSTMVQVLVPEMARSVTRAGRLAVFRRARRIVFVAAAAIAAATFFAPYFLILLYGTKYEQAAPVAIAVFLSAAGSAIAQVYLAWFYATRVPLSVPTGMLITTVVGVALIAGLAGLGIFGAAVGLLLMHVSTAAVIVLIWHANDGRKRQV